MKNVLYIFGLSVFLSGPSVGDELDVVSGGHHYFSVSDQHLSGPLKVMAEPNTTSSVVGEIEVSKTLIEVSGVSQDGQWALVHVLVGEGWVPTANLRPQYPLTYGSSNVPIGLNCVGDSRAWTLALGRFVALLEEPGASKFTYNIENVQEYRNPDTVTLLQNDEGSVAFDLSGHTGVCKSDIGNISPWKIEIYVGDRFLEGCCSLTR